MALPRVFGYSPRAVRIFTILPTLAVRAMQTGPPMQMP